MNSTNFPYLNPQLDEESRVEDLLNRLTFKEKCTLLLGKPGGKVNVTPSIPRLGIPEFKMCDGPNGITHNALDGGLATYFPTGIQIASTWNTELVHELGKALGEEIRAIGYHGSLGPAVNIDRTPMNGRTFEYYSEDPYLAGEIGSAAIRGIQSQKLAGCVKHFVANNQKTRRFTVDARVSQRALHEIYYPAFKACVQKGGVLTIMSSYNKVNGLHSSENKDLLRHVLMDEWGFQGVVISDWNATRNTSGILGLVESGCCVEMGDPQVVKFNPDKMQALHDAGTFPDAIFDDNVRRYLRVMVRCGVFDDPATLPAGSINTPGHQDIARQVAAEGMVLLKNDRSILPLDIKSIKKIALLGFHADQKYARGGGSPAVGATYEVTIREGLKRKCAGNVEITADPDDADVAITCIGLGHSGARKEGDHEGADRRRFDLSPSQARLVNKVARKNPDTIVVCVNGSPFGMEAFVNNVPAIIEAWYGGEELGNVVADILFGDVNPSGKVPITFPKRLKDVAAHENKQTYPGKKDVVRYDEGIFVGYRHFDTANIAPRFPFGFGLSYTSFSFHELSLSTTDLTWDDSLFVQLVIRNEGSRDGKEVVQLYIQESAPRMPRPVKELRRFAKVSVAPGASVPVQFEITRSDLAYFDDGTMEWKVQNGEFEVLIGNSSRDIFLVGKFCYHDS